MRPIQRYSATKARALCACSDARASYSTFSRSNTLPARSEYVIVSCVVSNVHFSTP